MQMPATWFSNMIRHEEEDLIRAVLELRIGVDRAAVDPN